MKANHSIRWIGIFFLVIGIASVAPARGEDLIELYLQARDYDSEYQVARLTRAMADESLKESRAGVLPQVTADVNLSQNFQNVLTFPASPTEPDFFRDYSNTQYTISLTQPIYRSDVYYRIPQAKAEVRRAEAEFVAAEQELIFRLARAHFNFLAARDNLDLAAAERIAVGRQLSEAEERLGSGLTTVTEVHEARARFAIAQTEEIDGVDRLEEFRRAIAGITGVQPIDLKYLSEIFPLVTPDSPDVEQWVEAARFRNPRLLALQAAIEFARQEVRRQRGQRLPTLDLVVSYSDEENSGADIGTSLQRDIKNTSFGLRLGIPIFDGGRAGALTRTAALREQIAMQNLEAERHRVDDEVRASFQGVVSGIDRVEALVKSVFSQEAALSAREEGLRSGVDTGLDVLNARRELFSARRDLARARYSYILNSLRLKQSSGVLGEHDLRQINAYLQ